MKKLLAGFVSGVVISVLCLDLMKFGRNPQLGMTVDQVSRSLGFEVVLSQGGRLYPVGHAQTEGEKERDLRYYFEDKRDDAHNFFYGFNERKVLIKIIESRTQELYPPQSFDPSVLK